MAHATRAPGARVGAEPESNMPDVEEKFVVEVSVTQKVAGLMWQAEASIRSQRASERESLGISYADTRARAVAEALRQVASYLTPEAR